MADLLQNQLKVLSTAAKSVILINRKCIPYYTRFVN